MERLLEREGELAALRRLVESGGGLLVVEGRAGIGKTALVRAACRHAEAQGWEPLRARGSPLEAGFAFGVVRQLFERRLNGAGAEEREALLAGPAAAVGPLLLGRVREAGAGDTAFAVLHGLYWLTANAAGRRPVLLAVDDAQWADRRRCAGWRTWRRGWRACRWPCSWRCGRSGRRPRIRRCWVCAPRRGMWCVPLC